MPLIARGALVVSCQARPDNPLHGSVHMTAMARAAVAGGAGGIRANGAADIAAIRAALAGSGLPLIGLLKRRDPGSDIEITPDLAAARAVAEAGADIVALDATARLRAGEGLAALIDAVRGRLGRAVLADISTLEEGLEAASLGAAYVATTLSGYTGAPTPDGPDLDLVAALARASAVPVVAEGRFSTPEHVAEAFSRGAYAVVVGTAITNPREITHRFVAACAPMR